MKLQLDTLREASLYIQKLENGINLVCTYAEEKRIPETYPLITQISHGLEWLQEVLKLTQTIQCDKINIDQINGSIDEIVSAMENEDWRLVSDVLKYELLEVLVQWKEKVDDTLNYHKYEVGNKDDK